MKSLKKHMTGLVLAAAVSACAAPESEDGRTQGVVGTGDSGTFGSQRNPSGDECCSDPGQIAECWWQDAERDGATCSANSNCKNGNICNKDETGPSGKGLCTCDGDEDCRDGVCFEGICGPSFCNGYLTCSCWGGCEQKYFGDAHYDTPEKYCQNELATAPYCCDGQYPNIPGTEATGYCSTSASCLEGGGCTSDAQCLDDDNPCKDPHCDATGVCGSVNDDSNTCSDSNLCTVESCRSGTCLSEPLDCGDANACTLDTCNPAITSGDPCVHTAQTGLVCDDGLWCTESDKCTASAVCNGAAKSCGVDTVCTTHACDEAADSCKTTYTTNPCDDGNACTINDLCSNGSCVGTALNCPADCHETPDVVCTADTCVPATGLVHKPIANCCTNDSQCNSSNGGCSTSLPPSSAGCVTTMCANNQCTCAMEPVGTPCTAVDIGDYPENCYAGQCGLLGGSPNGLCAAQPTGAAPTNNLCSKLWSGATTLDTSGTGYLGSFANTAESGTLARTGSTRCGYDNYRAAGEDCFDKDGESNLGSIGKDVVYVFEYQTNSETRFQLYSYVVKVQADYDVALYIEDDITSKSECPEGATGVDATTDVTVNGPRCVFPYNDAAPTPPPYVIEDECNANGNLVASQGCCDPCTQGYSCGYKWCKRGYDLAGTSCNLCVSGDCDATWNYPQDPIDCSPNLPPPIGYSDYTKTASAVIFPDGATDSSWRKVFIFIDGEGADGVQGNFHLSVEKRVWSASPCDRRNDDPRVYDVTTVGPGGQVFLGNLTGAVNSMHSKSGTCGGYSCSDSDWVGGSACHASTSGNKFWPAEVHFKVDRKKGAGNSKYCFITDESVTNAADAVLTYAKRVDSDAPSICDEVYDTGGSSPVPWCARNNSGSNVKLELTVKDGEFWLFGLSEYAYRNRPCLAGTDNCNFKIAVYEGSCPLSCTSIVYTGTYTATGVSGDVNFGTGTVTTADGDDYNIVSGDGHDEVWKFYNNIGTDTSITFKLTPSSTGKAVLGVYTCTNSILGSNYSTTSGASVSVTVTVPAGVNPVYVVADSYGSSSAVIGAYTLNAKWGGSPAGCNAPDTWSPPYNSAVKGTVTVNSSSITPSSISDSTSTSTDAAYDYNGSASAGWAGKNYIYQINVNADKTVTFNMCNGSIWDMMLGLYDCTGKQVKSDDDGCGWVGDKSRISSYALKAASSPYYLIIDGYSSSSYGTYTLYITSP
jgi:hypothetical protein